MLTYSFQHVLLLPESVFEMFSIVQTKYWKRFQCRGVLVSAGSFRHVLLHLRFFPETAALTRVWVERFHPPKESTGKQNHQIQISLRLMGDSFDYPWIAHPIWKLLELRYHNCYHIDLYQSIKSNNLRRKQPLIPCCKTPYNYNMTSQKALGARFEHVSCQCIQLCVAYSTGQS